MITTDFLNDVAMYTIERIAKVVINGEVEISDFSVKQIAGSNCVINYFVPADLVSEINIIELQDAGSAVIASNSVNIPIAADQLMIQTIEIREVEL